MEHANGRRDTGPRLIAILGPYQGGKTTLLDAIRSTKVAAGGNGLSAAASALAAVQFGSSDPSVWLVALAGPFAGTLLVGLVLLLSVPAICMLVYFVAGAARQLEPLARLPWHQLVALIVVPLVVVAFKTAWTLEHVVTLASMGSLIFFSLVGVVATDFWILRRGSITLHHLYVSGPAGRYWYWAGVNWVALAVVAAGTATYLWIYDPITLATREGFRYVGAALPVMGGTAVAYLAAMRLVAPRRADESCSTEVEGSEIKVQL